MSKPKAIGHQLTDKDILIDDYNKNLLEWQKAGGTSVKAKTISITRACTESCGTVSLLM